MTKVSKVSAIKNPGLQDDHDPSDIGQRTANKQGQGIVRDERGQEQPADKNRAQQTDSKKREQSQKDGPAAYAPHDEDEKKGQKPTDATKQKPDTPPDADSLGGGSQGGM